MLVPDTVSALFVVPDVELVIELPEAITKEPTLIVPATCRSKVPDEPIFSKPAYDPPKPLAPVRIILDEGPIKVPPEYELLPESVRLPEPFWVTEPLPPIA